MLKLTKKGSPDARKLVLGFDAGCVTCAEMAKHVEEKVGDKIEIQNLNDPQLLEWRKEALGEGAPWAPTLFEIKEDKVRAWTGKKMGLQLTHFLGPIATWRVMQALGEAGSETEIVKESPVAQAVTGMSRGQFLKGVGGAVVAMSMLSGASLSEAAGARENPSMSKGTREQRAEAKRVVRSSRQFRRLERELGQAFDFRQAKFIFDEGLKVATVAVPTTVFKGTGAAATFFVELEGKEVSYYHHLISDHSEKGKYVVTAYQNGESLGRTIVDRKHVVTPDGRRFSRKEFLREARKLEHARELEFARRRDQVMLYAQGRCSRCRSKRYRYCTFAATTSCVIGGFLNPWAGAICAYVYWYGISQGCRSWARSTCYKDGYC